MEWFMHREFGTPPSPLLFIYLFNTYFLITYNGPDTGCTEINKMHHSSSHGTDSLK